MTTLTDVDAFLAGLTEDEAIRLLWKMEAHFGWTCTVFSRADAESSWVEYHEKEGDMPDEVWEKVKLTWYWRRGMGDVLVERGWSLVHDAVGEAIHG